VGYQKRIQEVLGKVNEEEMVKCKLEEKIAITKANLRLFK
jgi:hypothetical protein